MKLLAPAAYTDPGLLSRELDRIFARSWQFAGAASQLAAHGDYLAADIAGEPVVLTNDGGSLRALSAVCRHRAGAVAIGCGHARALRCAYHGWAYGLAGELRGCPGMEQTVGFDKAGNGLVPVRIDTWGGFLFVNFDDDAPSLSEYLGDMPAVLAAYDCENLVLTRTRTHIVDCNWKIHIENAMEEYHLPSVHGSTLNLLDFEHFDVPANGAWLGIRERHAGTRALLQEDRQHAFPPIPGIHGHAAEGTNYVCINPSTMLGMTIDCVWYIELHPLGPARTRVVVGSCFPRATTQLSDFAERAQYYYKRWDKSIGEDNQIARLQQRGMDSPLARPGRLSSHEYLIPKLGSWWIEHTVDRGAALEKS